MAGPEMTHRVRILVVLALAAVGSVTVPERASGQILSVPLDGLPLLEPYTAYPPTVATAASGPFLPISAWDQTLATNQRFIILTNLHSDAVLDRETGLVWARRAAVYANEREMTWSIADRTCHWLTIGNRQGWRLPTAAELGTLFDLGRARNASSPRLPEGHPFVLQSNESGYFFFWTGEAVRDQLASQTRMWVGWMEDGSFLESVRDNGFNLSQALCVRDQR